MGCRYGSLFRASKIKERLIQSSIIAVEWLKRR